MSVLVRSTLSWTAQRQWWARPHTNKTTPSDKTPVPKRFTVSLYLLIIWGKGWARDETEQFRIFLSRSRDSCPEISRFVVRRDFSTGTVPQMLVMVPTVPWLSVPGQPPSPVWGSFTWSLSKTKISCIIKVNQKNDRILIKISPTALIQVGLFFVGGWFRRSALMMTPVTRATAPDTTKVPVTQLRPK